ncbi:MAG: ABC transporter ATP-binding protein/permease [Clostridiales bacterium]|jgi:ATP-binding cassette subfamily B protein|nr:ABC transporter ATP-binding protein/permease [Clostridiales bacterium]
MKKLNVFQAFLKIIPKFARVSPLMFVIWLLLSLAHGLSYGIIAPVTQYFLDKATGYAQHNTTLTVVILGLVVLTLAQIIKQALNGITNFTCRMYYCKTEGIFAVKLHEKMNKIAPICFEDTSILDEMNKAIQGKNEAVWFTGFILIMFTFYIPYFVCIAVYLLKVKPLLVLSLLLVFVPVLLTHILRTKVFTKAEDKSAPVRRECDYYDSCITGREYFKETRILGTFSYFRRLYEDSLSLLNKIRLRACVKSDITKLGMELLSLGGYIGIFLLLLNGLMSGQVGVGAFAAIFASIQQMFGLMNEWIGENFGAIANNFSRVQFFLRFMQMPERGGKTAEIPDNADITINKVSFTYPGKEQKAIDTVTLTIKNGETVALVGENGSGKSTLVRLLTGLYLPDDGNVLHGTADTKEIASQSLFKKISAVFQKYQRYQMTLRENIGISNVNEIADNCSLDNVCIQAGINKNSASLTDGYDTMLSREFNGVDLSGGQWQRTAIARGLFRTHNFILMDEPTAAIDPMEETRIYNRFAEIAKDKTAVIVTHRLGSVKLADRILVMKQGRLAEQGTHQELMGKNGEYSRLYKSQEKWYK